MCVDRGSEAIVWGSEVRCGGSPRLDDGNPWDVAADFVCSRPFQRWCVCLLLPDSWQAWSAVHKWCQTDPHSWYCRVLWRPSLWKSAWKAEDVLHPSLPHWSVWLSITRWAIIMVALCNRADHYIFTLFFFLLLSFFFFPRLISAVGDWMFTILWHMVWP